MNRREKKDSCLSANLSVLSCVYIHYWYRWAVSGRAAGRLGAEAPIRSSVRASRRSIISEICGCIAAQTRQHLEWLGITGACARPDARTIAITSYVGEPAGFLYPQHLMPPAPVLRSDQTWPYLCPEFWWDAVSSLGSTHVPVLPLDLSSGSIDEVKWGIRSSIGREKYQTLTKT